MIIRSIRHKGLKRFVEKNDARGLQSKLVGRVRNIIAAMVLADGLSEFVASAPPGWRVHRLSGARKNTWSVSTSGNWRITFEEDDGVLELLDLEDYH